MPLSWAILKAAGADLRLPCTAAFAICTAQCAGPARVGEAADALGVRVTQCQLGLFGHKPGQEPPPAPPTELLAAVAHHAEGGLTCAEAWHIADSLGANRRAVGAAADSAGVKVVACQLGCF